MQCVGWELIRNWYRRYGYDTSLSVLYDSKLAAELLG